MLEHLNFRELLQRWLPLQLLLLEYFTLAASQIFAMLMPNKWYPISTTDAVVLTHNWYIYIQGSLEFCNSNTLFTRNITGSRTQRDWHIADAATLLEAWGWREEIFNHPGWRGPVETTTLLGQWKMKRDSPAAKVAQPETSVLAEKGNLKVCSTSCTSPSCRACSCVGDGSHRNATALKLTAMAMPSFSPWLPWFPRQETF